MMNNLSPRSELMMFNHMHYQLRNPSFVSPQQDPQTYFYLVVFSNYSPPMDPDVKGIPDFWFNIFRNVSMLSEMMQDYDEPILKALLDIKGWFKN